MHTAFNLTSEAFWAALPGRPSPWQELTAAGDPLLLRGRYVLPKAGGVGASSAAGGGGSGEVLVQLSATNRWAVALPGRWGPLA